MTLKSLWTKSKNKLLDVQVECQKLIENFRSPENMLVDFANEFIGGAACESGCV